MSKLFLLLRAVLFYVILAVLVIIFTTALFVVLPLPFQKGRLQISRAWSWLVLKLGVWTCGMRYHIIGQENLSSTPAVYVIKHQSAWETIVMTSILPPNCCVAKESLLNIPLFGWSLRMTQTIPIDRKASISAFKKVLQTGKTRLKEGLSIVIYPEGTRTLPGEHPKFHKTAMMLAKEAKVPVIPIAHNSGSCWRRNSFLKYPGVITIVIGKALDSTTLSSETLNTEVYEWIKDTMLTLEGKRL